MNLLIADSGPLFSLAAGDLLGVLDRFSLAVTDVVKEETFDKGLLANCSIEARRLIDFYNHPNTIVTVIQTQVGSAVRAKRVADPQYQQPRNLGELSIQSYLIELRVSQPDAAPVVLFEDGWFLRNAAALPLGTLISTEAFLINLERLKIITSAANARKAIQMGRPDASLIVHTQKLGKDRQTG
jgi:hypothetical protein